jgi:hypothetical protein
VLNKVADTVDLHSGDALVESAPLTAGIPPAVLIRRYFTLATSSIYIPFPVRFVPLYISFSSVVVPVPWIHYWSVTSAYFAPAPSSDSQRPLLCRNGLADLFSASSRRLPVY